MVSESSIVCCIPEDTGNTPSAFSKGKNSILEFYIHTQFSEVAKTDFAIQHETVNEKSR